MGIEIEFQGSGVAEVGVVSSLTGDLAPKIRLGQTIVKLTLDIFRPTEVETLLGDASKAKNQLGWEPEITAREMCEEMVHEDHKAARRFALLKEHGLDVPVSIEF